MEKIILCYSKTPIINLKEQNKSLLTCLQKAKKIRHLASHGVYFPINLDRFGFEPFPSYLGSFPQLESLTLRFLPFDSSFELHLMLKGIAAAKSLKSLDLSLSGNENFKQDNDINENSIELIRGDSKLRELSLKLDTIPLHPVLNFIGLQNKLNSLELKISTTRKEQGFYLDNQSSKQLMNTLDKLHIIEKFQLKTDLGDLEESELNSFIDFLGLKKYKYCTVESEKTREKIFNIIQRNIRL